MTAGTADRDAEAGDTLGDLDPLAEYVKQHHVDLIYITLPMTSQPRILGLLQICTIRLPRSISCRTFSSSI